MILSTNRELKSPYELWIILRVWHNVKNFLERRSAVAGAARVGRAIQIAGVIEDQVAIFGVHSPSVPLPRQDRAPSRRTTRPSEKPGLKGRRIGDAGRFGQARTKKEVSRACIKNFGTKRVTHGLLLLRG